MAHVKHVHARWFACEADAEATIAEYEGRGQGRRGRPPRPWRYHAVRYRVVAERRRTRRARRGRPAKTDLPPTEAGYRLVVEVSALANPEERTMGGPYWPRRYLPRPVQMLRFSRPIRSRTRPWNLVFVGSRIPQRLPPCGWRSPNGLPR
jgi:hypothetical protein